MKNIINHLESPKEYTLNKLRNKPSQHVPFTPPYLYALFVFTTIYIIILLLPRPDS